MFSKGHQKTLDILRELFPLHEIYTEYPYIKLLEHYYKEKKVDTEHQDYYMLKKGKSLFADIYNATIGTVIEINGEQHYEPVLWSKKVSVEQAVSNLNRQKLIDRLKQRICNETNTKLVIIKYTELKELNNTFLLERL